MSETTWVEAEIMEVAQAVDSDGNQAAIISMTFDDPELLGASYVHRLESREDVEEVIRALRQAADELWPPQ